MANIKYTTLILLACLICTSAFGQLPGNPEVSITNEGIINTENLEYSPAFYEDGIVFISTKVAANKYKVKDRRIDKNIMSIYHSTRNESGILEVPVPFATELLSTVHEGPLTFDRTAETMYFTRNNFINGKKRRAKDGIMKLKIFAAQKVGDSWQNIEDLPFNDDESSACHPSISVEGDVLFFASDREGGFGGMDIYYSTREGEIWNEPINMGLGINTEGDDVFPFMHADGTLYFSSNWHEGAGGLDIYYTKREGDGWAKPTNLGEPFNTEADDFGFIIDRDRKNGYFSSNRDGGLGEDDIYSYYVDGFQVEEDKGRQLLLTVIDEATGNVIPNANVSYMNLDELEGTKVITDEAGNTVTLTGEGDELVLKLAEDDERKGLTDVEGKMPLTLNGDNYIIKVEKPGYQTSQIAIPAGDEETFIVSLGRASDAVPLAGVITNENGEAVSGLTITVDDGVNRQTFTSNEYGNFNADLKRDRDYLITVSKNGQVISTQTISTTDVTAGEGSPLLANFTIPGNTSIVNTNTGFESGSNTGSTSTSTVISNPVIREGTVIQLPNIYYNFNDAAIRPDAMSSLDALAAILLQYPEIEIELASHTDARGRTRYNKRLSQKRANNVARYLKEKGLDGNRISSIGYGESQVRNHCVDGVDCDEYGHQYNRRTEVRVTKMNNDVQVSYLNNAPSTVDAAPPSVTSSITGGFGGSSSTFYVIAGAFQNENNANRRLNKIRDIGYASAEIMNTGNSSYMSVVVGTFSSKSEAQATVDALQGSHSIRSFIKRK